MESANIELVCIKDLLGERFFIPNYQRGYRWTEQQIKDLLEDLKDFASEKKRIDKVEFYCLQPLVVKKMEDGQYQVIDGQQRLTTIFLLLKYLQNTAEAMGLSTNTYELKYERDLGRDMNEISDKIDDSQIDFYYMTTAYNAIKVWFENQGDNGVKGKICSALLENKFDDAKGKDVANNVRFIWYESQEENPRKVFTRLNKGKISLTNAELIKALFLKKKNFEGEGDVTLLQKEIASEWDNIEYTLQNEEFWLFLNQKGYKKPTRIDMIFDIICEQNKFEQNVQSNVKDDYKTFRYFYSFFKGNESKALEKWSDVKDIFRVFQEWYNDLDLYHYVGYLIDQGKKVTDLLAKWMEMPDKDAFVYELRSQIRTHLKERKCLNLDQQYEIDDDNGNKGRSKTGCRPILLLHNVETVIKQGRSSVEKYAVPVFYKFPFHIYKMENWDVEHIDSATENDMDDENSRKEWLCNVYNSVDAQKQEEIEKYVNGERNDFEILKKSLKIKFDNQLSETEKNQVMNFTLLDSGTNRGYGNAIYSAKRRIIIGKDSGEEITIPKITKQNTNSKFEFIKRDSRSSFIPPCTKQVFMKYYSAVSSDPNYWTREDAVAYKNNIYETLKDFGVKTNDGGQKNG